MNLGRYICRLCHLIKQFPFTEIQTELDYQYQKVNEQVTEQRKTCDLRKLENFKKIPEMLGTEGKCPSGHLQDKFLQLCQKIAKASAVKHTIEKAILFIFVNLSTKFCLRLQDYYARLISNPHLFKILPSRIVGYCTVLVAVTHQVLQHS